MLNYHSIAALCEAAEKEGLPLSRLVLQDQAEQMEQPESQLLEQMTRNLEVMRAAVKAGRQPGLRSVSGLTGGDALRMMNYALGNPLSGGIIAKASARALAVAEYNAAMGKIVAAPTAGACGILPAAILTVLKERHLPDRAGVMALFTAGAIGMVIANQASIAGAQGGCQAECGSASAMAAGALVELAGGTPAQVGHACAMALKNQLGLVCDPVAGLVEIPCIKRNVSGTAIAFTAADMALAGIESKIPVDEVVDAMRRVGDSLPCTLKETAGGGLATSPTGIQMRKSVFGA